MHFNLIHFQPNTPTRGAAMATRTLLKQRRTLEQFLNLLAVRRHATLRGISYAELCKLHPEVFGDFVVEYQAARDTDAGFRSSSVETHERPMLEILELMKLNVEDLDWCTVERQKFFDTHPLTYAVAHRVSLAMVFFGSRAFLEGLQERYRNRRVTLRNLLIHVKEVAQASPHNMFTRSYNPNAIRRASVRKHRRPAQLAMKLWRKFFKKNRARVPLHTNSSGCSRRKVMSTIARRMGAFTGKCYFQVLRQALANKMCFRPMRHRANQYTECGPGARAALNALEGVPHGLMIYAPGQDKADLYSAWAVKWMHVWRRVGKRLARSLPAIKESVLAFISASSLDLKGLQCSDVKFW